MSIKPWSSQAAVPEDGRRRTVSAARRRQSDILQAYTAYAIAPARNAGAITDTRIGRKVYRGLSPATGTLGSHAAGGWGRRFDTYLAHFTPLLAPYSAPFGPSVRTSVR